MTYKVFTDNGLLLENVITIKTHLNAFNRLENSVEPLRTLILGVQYKSSMLHDIIRSIQDKFDARQISENQAILEIEGMNLDKEQDILLHFTNFICENLTYVSLLNKCFQKIYVVEKIIRKVTGNFADTSDYTNSIEEYRLCLESGSKVVEKFIREISNVEVIIREVSELPDAEIINLILRPNSDEMHDALVNFYNESIQLLNNGKSLLE